MWHYYDMFKTMLKPFNESKLVMGIIMIFLNVASKYVELGFSKTQEHALRNGLGREILIFAVAFTATKDLIMAILITAAFQILSNVLLHEDSKYCLMSEKMKKISKLIDKNKDGVISKEEEDRVIKILEQANKKEEEEKNKTFSDPIYESFKGNRYM
jgi:hypothetical protein